VVSQGPKIQSGGLGFENSPISESRCVLTSPVPNSEGPGAPGGVEFERRPYGTPNIFWLHQPRVETRG